MFLQNYVSAEQYSKMLEHFGQSKLKRVSQMMTKYSDAWHIKDISCIPYYSVNILFHVTLMNGKQAVVKIHAEVDRYTTREISMLTSGLPHYCKLLAYNEVDGILLLEKSEGKSLHQIDDIRDRLTAFLAVFKHIHRPSTEEEVQFYPSYLQLLNRIKDWVEQKQIAPLLIYIDEAKHFYAQLSTRYTDKVLLHGDLHHDNIIYINEQQSTVIDPKGVVDSYLYDLPRFLLNELDEGVIGTDKGKIIDIINYFSEQLLLPFNDIAKVLCIESMLSITWTIQDEVELSESSVAEHLAKHLYCRQFLF